MGDTLITIKLTLNIRSRHLLTTNALSADTPLTLEYTVYIRIRVNIFTQVTISSINSALKDIKLIRERTKELISANLLDVIIFRLTLLFIILLLSRR